MLGWCMVLLAALMWLPTRAIGIDRAGRRSSFQDVFGLLGARAAGIAVSWIWEFVYPVGAEVTLGQDGPSIAVLYSIVPWIGVMAAGYAFGAIMIREPAERRRLCLRIGLSATALFLVGRRPRGHPEYRARRCAARALPAPESAQVSGVAAVPDDDARADDRAAAACGARARLVRRRAGDFGRVPMFYYLLHIPVIHVAALVVWLVRDGAIHPEWFGPPRIVSVPPDTGGGCRCSTWSSSWSSRCSTFRAAGSWASRLAGSRAGFATSSGRATSP